MSRLMALRELADALGAVARGYIKWPTAQSFERELAIERRYAELRDEPEFDAVIVPPPEPHDEGSVAVVIDLAAERARRRVNRQNLGVPKGSGAVVIDIVTCMPTSTDCTPKGA